MVVADDEADAMEAARDETADEAWPGAALVVAGGELEPEHASLAGGRHAGRDEDRHRHDPPALADLDVRRVEPDVRVGDLAERSGPERLDLGVERGAHPADLALADALDPEGPHQVVDPARADPAEVGLLDDREEGPFRPPPGLEQGREVRPVADPRDGQLDRPDPGIPAPIAVAVAVGHSAPRVALAAWHAGQLADLGLHDRLGEHPDALAQQVDVAVGARLAQGLEQGHPVIGHRGVPSCRRFLVRRREDGAVAVLIHGPAVTPSLGTQPLTS
jgi:hypothetical protein